jgi:hypothetical protein
MSEAPCPNCGVIVDVGDVFRRGACPKCDTPLTELHVRATDGGGDA